MSVLFHEKKINMLAHTTMGLKNQLKSFTGFSSKSAIDDRVDSLCMGVNFLTTNQLLNNRDSSNVPILR